MLCSNVEVDDEPIYDVGAGEDEAAEDIYGEIMYRRHNRHRRGSQPAVPAVVCIMYTCNTYSHTQTHTNTMYMCTGC